MSIVLLKDGLKIRRLISPKIEPRSEEEASASGWPHSRTEEIEERTDTILSIDDRPLSPYLPAKHSSRPLSRGNFMYAQIQRQRECT